MFSLRVFIRNGLLQAVGRMAEYQIILNAAGWLEKGVLTEADLADIQAALDRRREEQGERQEEQEEDQEQGEGQGEQGEGQEE